MRKRVTLLLTMELLSDAIIGSGYSVPGGEDIAVCQDTGGFPYLKGTTLKGLLLESAQNLCDWEGGNPDSIEEIFGTSGWEGKTDGRRLQLTELRLDPKLSTVEECYSTRAFTSIENGIVKDGTLRTAACVRRGLRFTGTMSCAAQDADFLRRSLRGIKWIGTMRSRGFGRVKFSAEECEETNRREALPASRCIRYRLRTELPVLITDLARSYANGTAARTYLPGSAVRGMVLSELAASDPVWFEDHKRELLSSRTRFLDAIPCLTKGVSLPPVLGFYGEKAKDELISVLRKDVSGKKRVGLGDVCALDGDTVRCRSARLEEAARIQRHVHSGKEETQIFQTSYLGAGQEFEGTIQLDDPALAGKISEVFCDCVWLGADRYEGFGKCAVTLLESTDQPAWQSAYGYRKTDSIGETVYLLAISPFTMTNACGEPCGIDCGELARWLEVESVEVLACSTSMAEIGGYNRTWGCRVPAVRMYDRGSVFQLKCSPAPSLEAIERIQREGLGIRRAEGCGSVLFLRPELYEALKRKLPEETEEQAGETAEAVLRRARIRWVMERSDSLHLEGLSRSQLGEIQSLCEKAMSARNCSELMQHLEKNRNDRGAKHGVRFVEIDRLIRTMLEQPLNKTLGIPCAAGTETDRLRLLCMLFNYSRKGGERRA